MKHALPSLTVFLAVAFLLLTPSQVYALDYSLEKNFSCTSDISDCEGIVEPLVGLIRSKGWRCDTVRKINSGVTRPGQWIPSLGFTVYCNGYRYVYEVKDHGVRWMVTVRD